MYCKSCGNKIDYDSMYCSFCGIRQSELNKPSDIEESNDDTKTLNVNLASGRQKKSKQNQSESKVYKELKYDPTYEKDKDAVLVGVVLLILTFLLSIFQPFKNNYIDSYNQFLAISSIVSLILRISITIWVVDIAKRQNRNRTDWGFYAFFLPSISLINIGCLRRLKVDGQMSYAELKKKELTDFSTEEQKKLDDLEIENVKKIGNKIALILLILTFISIASLFLAYLVRIIK